MAAPYSGRTIDYLGSGLLASRPAAPNLFPGTVGLYYCTDVGTEKLTAWDGLVWADVAGGGSGDVVGPGSATADAVAVYDGPTGKLLKDGVLLSKLRTQSIQIACSDETTALTTGTAKVTFRMPYAFTLTGVRASVTTAPTGSVLTVNIKESGSTILSTKITIDATEKTSTTAATPPVISDSSLADDAEITIDIDTVGSTVAGAGLKVTLIGYAT